MHPLVRWQYRGGIPESERKALYFPTSPTAWDDPSPEPPWPSGPWPEPGASTRWAWARRKRHGQAWLDALPIPVSTPGYDTAPYFTAALWVTRDPET